MVYRYTRYEMKDKHLIVILLSFIVAITLVSCTDKTTNSAEVVSSTEAITSEESTTTEVATSETINVTTSCETTTVPVINEDVYVSDAFPNVNIQSSTDGTITFSIELDDENVIEEIDFNHDWSTYRVFRADKKIISLWLFGCDYDTSNSEYFKTDICIQYVWRKA